MYLPGMTPSAPSEIFVNLFHGWKVILQVCTELFVSVQFSIIKFRFISIQVSTFLSQFPYLSSIMTSQFTLILCSCTSSAKLPSFSYLLCLHPPYLSFSLSLTTYRNTSQDKGEYDSGTEHCTNTIRVQMVRLRLVIRLVCHCPSPLFAIPPCHVFP